jgi:hypothetical protein
MGKIGDLWVKLGLKKQEFDKGMNDAEKKTEGFGSKMQKIKGVGLAVWAAIGGAVLKVASDMVKSTNTMEDKWEMFTAKAKAGWNSFIKTLANGDWSNFISNFKKEVKAAEYLTAALQDTTEVENSIRLQKAAMADELAALEILMRDQTKSYKERAAAAEKYIDKVSPLYDQEIKRLYDLKKAYMISFGQGLFNENLSPKVMDYVEKFLTEYGKDTQHLSIKIGRSETATLKELMDAALVPYDPQMGLAVNKTRFPKEYNAQIDRRNAIESLRLLSKKWFPELPQDFLYALGQRYENGQNGDQIQALVEVITAYSEALGAKKDNLQKVYGILNSATAKSGNGQTEDILNEIKTDIKDFKSLTDITSQAVVQFPTMPDIIPDDWLTRNREKIDEALAEVQRLQDIALEMNRAFSDAVAQSLSGATQAFVDCVMGIEGADASQVLMNLMQPFADMAKSLGELFISEGIAMEMAKKTLANPMQGGGALIAAGVGLVAIGSALSAGIQAIGRGASGGSSTSYSGEGASAANTETYKSELTVYVEGKISGKDIVLSGNNTLSSWRR